MTLPLRATMIKHAQEGGESWRDTVIGRLEISNDLVAEEAIYHSSCMTKFILKKINDKNEGKTCRFRYGRWFQQTMQLVRRN